MLRVETLQEYDDRNATGARAREKSDSRWIE